MQFQIQFSFPFHDILLLLFELLKELQTRAELHFRHPFKVPQSLKSFEVFELWSAAAVTIPEEQQRTVRPSLVFEIRLTHQYILETAVGVVGVRWWEVGQQLGAVDALPQERAVRELVVHTPRQLLRQEIFDASRLDDLRDLRTVAECVRQEEHLDLLAELARGEALSVEHLSDHGLAAGHVAVELDPRAADDLEAAISDGLLDSRVDLRVALFQPVVLSDL